MKLTREKGFGFAGATLLCLLLVWILSLIYLHTKIRQQEEGILIEMEAVPAPLNGKSGEPESAGGEPGAPAGKPEVVPEVPSEPVPSPKPSPAKLATTPKVPAAKQPPVITQNTEQTAAIAAAKEKAAKEKQEEQARREAEKRRLAEEQRKKAEEERLRREAINAQMSGAFGSGGTAASGNGGTAGSGAGTGVNSGSGGMGSFDLAGRSLRGGGLQRPAYDIQEEGSIVVNITVDPQGNVIQANIRLKGTNIENPGMRQAALEAARKTKFSVIESVQNQIGTITYRYTLK